MGKPMKRYDAHGLAGCVEIKRRRATGMLVGIYHAVQAEIDDEPSHPWATVCEEHNHFVVHRTLSIARDHAAWPEWCEHCAEIITRRHP